MPTDLIRLMQSLFLPAAERSRSPFWQPAVDVTRTRKGWLIKAELAGVRPEDIQISVTGNHLRIQGSRRDWMSEEGCCHYRMEIAYSSFERSVELPADPGKARVETEYRDGMLLIRIRRGNPS